MQTAGLIAGAGAVVGAGFWWMAKNESTLPAGWTGLSPSSRFLAVGVAGVLVGGVVSMFSPSIGAGIAGAAGGAMGSGLLAAREAADNGQAVSGMGRIPGYAVRKFGHTPEQPLYWNYPSRQVHWMR